MLWTSQVACNRRALRWPKPVQQAVSPRSSPSWKTSTITSNFRGSNTMWVWKTSKRCKVVSQASKRRISLKIQGNQINLRCLNSLIDHQGQGRDSNPRENSSNPTALRATMSNKLIPTLPPKVSSILMPQFNNTSKRLLGWTLLSIQKPTKYSSNF